MITQQKACRLQCSLHTKFETSYDKFRSETLPFIVKICIMITQERACKLQRLLHIQESDLRWNYRLKNGTKSEDLKFDQNWIFIQFEDLIKTSPCR